MLKLPMWLSKFQKKGLVEIDPENWREVIENVKLSSHGENEIIRIALEKL